jgi:cytochrome oxidase assembly protein ShyY1
VRGWRFVFQRRWFGYLAVAIAFAIACVLLSRWQFDRRDEAVTEITRLQVNYDATPVPVGEALPTLDSFDADKKRLPVTMTGKYLTSEQLLVRNRPYNGSPGFEVLTPLLLPDGTVFVVDRGWVPPGSTEDGPDSVPSAPEGTVTVTARLKAGETTILGRTAPAGQVATIHLDTVAELLDRPTYTGAYGLLASESPAPATRPAAAARPQLDEGPHLSYAVQWIVFALLGFFGLGYAVRQEYRLVNADDPAERARAAIRREKRALKRTDADIEDELLDSVR